MKTIKDLLDAVKEAKGITSDYALAKELGITSARICDYRKGNRNPDEYACLKIAEALGKDYNEIQAAVRIVAEKDEKRREVWQKYYKSIGGVAAALLVVVIINMTVSENYYNNQSLRTVQSEHNTNYAF